MSFFHVKSFWWPSFLMQNHFHDTLFPYTIIFPYVLFSCKIILVTIIYYAKSFSWQSFFIYNHFSTCPFPCKSFWWQSFVMHNYFSDNLFLYTIILPHVLFHGKSFWWQSFVMHNPFSDNVFHTQSFHCDSFLGIIL